MSDEVARVAALARLCRVFLLGGREGCVWGGAEISHTDDATCSMHPVMCPRGAHGSKFLN